MRDEPSGSALLDVAQRALMEEIAPTLSRELRYTALMVANAMRIVGREIDLGPRAARAREAALSRVAREGDGLAEDQVAAKLVQAIRAGDFDADATLHQALWENTAVAAGMWKPSLLAAAAEYPGQDSRRRGDGSRAAADTEAVG
jgi:Domain of unknown function (DUF6285)